MRKFRIVALLVTLLWYGGGRSAHAQAPSHDAAEAQPILVVDANGHTGAANRLLYWPYRNELITVSNDKTIRFWNLETGEPTRVLRPPIDRGDAGRLRAAALSPDNKFLAVGGESALRRRGDHAVYLIDPLEGRVVRTLAGHPAPIRWVAFSPDGKQLATACFDEKIRLFDVATGAVRQLLGHSRSVVGLDWSPDGRSLISGAWDQFGASLGRRHGAARCVIPHQRNVWLFPGALTAAASRQDAATAWCSVELRRRLPSRPPAPGVGRVSAVLAEFDAAAVWLGSRHNPQHGTAVLDVRTGAGSAATWDIPRLPTMVCFCPTATRS